MSGKLFSMELYRAFSSKRFWIIVVLIFLIMLASISEFISAAVVYGGTSVIGILDKLMEILIFDRFKALVILLLSGAVSYTVSDDLSSHFVRTVLGKVTVSEYVTVKLTVNVISVISALLVSFSLFCIFGKVVLGMPFFSKLTSGAGNFGFYASLISDVPWLYIPLSAILFGLFAVAMTTFGMAVSALYPGRYLAYTFPFGLFYLMHSFSATFPKPLSFWYICSGVQVLPVNGFLLNYMYGVGVFVCLTLIGAFLLYHNMRRRFANGNI